MTFRCALRFEPDKAKGPGYGLILASCPGFSAAPNTLLYMIKDPSNGMSLGPNGWQPGDAHLVPDAVAPSGEILSLSVGPAVVDSLELQAIYQVVLFTAAEHVLSLIHISTFAVTGDEATAARIKPHMAFRDGFNIAGDDVIREIVEQHVLRCEPPTVSRPKSWPRRLRGSERPVA